MQQLYFSKSHGFNYPNRHVLDSSPDRGVLGVAKFTYTVVTEIAVRVTKTINIRPHSKQYQRLMNCPLRGSRWRVR